MDALCVPCTQVDSYSDSDCDSEPEQTEDAEMGGIYSALFASVCKQLHRVVFMYEVSKAVMMIHTLSCCSYCVLAGFPPFQVPEELREESTANGQSPTRYVCTCIQNTLPNHTDVAFFRLSNRWMHEVRWTTFLWMHDVRWLTYYLNFQDEVHP